MGTEAALLTHGRMTLSSKKSEAQAAPGLQHWEPHKDGKVKAINTWRSEHQGTSTRDSNKNVVLLLRICGKTSVCESTTVFHALSKHPHSFSFPLKHEENKTKNENAKCFMKWKLLFSSPSYLVHRKQHLARSRASSIELSTIKRMQSSIDARD